MADEMMYTPDEWEPPVPEGPHNHKGHSEEKCVRCGWVMGHQPLNCNNDDTPHVFPSQLAEIERSRTCPSCSVLMPPAHLSVPCRPPQGTPLNEWCSECAALAAWQEARRG